MAEKLTLIDETLLVDHSKLNSEDQCYFWREFTSGKGYAFGPSNSLIANLKKKPSTSNSYELDYKRKAIRECSHFFRNAIKIEWLEQAVLVPIPGSKAIGDPDYDNRMERVCRGIRTQPGLDVRNLVKQNTSYIPSHERGHGEARITVEELLDLYEIDESVSQPEPSKIAIFDDVLTAGVHYRAMHTILGNRFPHADIVGFFVARRVFPPDEEESFDILD